MVRTSSPGSNRVADLSAAFADPVSHLGHWLTFESGGPDLHRIVASLVDVDDTLAVELARWSFKLTTPTETLSELAARHGRTSPALSQRRSRLLENLADIRKDPEVAQHPLVVAWRDVARRLVRLDDLNLWWRQMLLDAPSTAPWGCNQDVWRVIIMLAVGRPAIVSSEDAAQAWLIDRDLIDDSNRQPSLRAAADRFANEQSATGTTVVAITELDDAASDWGLSGRSQSAFRRLLEQPPVRRAVQFEGRLVILSEADARRAGAAAEAVGHAFNLSHTNAARLLEERQGRNFEAVMNDFRPSVASRNN